MNVLFHLPEATLTRCFRPVDVERLRQTHSVILESFHDAESLLRHFNQHADTLDALVTGWATPPLTVEMLKKAARLKVIVHSGGSIRGLIPEAAWNQGIRVATCNEIIAIGVAETTLGMILAGVKGIFPVREWTARGNWQDARLGTDHVVLRELFDLTIGIISASKVGRHVMRMLRDFEVNLLVADPFLTEAQAREMGATLVSLDTLLRRSDVVSLHAPALPATRHMLGKPQFRLMKDHSIFINTARGMIVDETALVEELKTGHLFAFIDVTDPEPPAVDHPFRFLPNVVLTPHLAGGISNGCLRQGRSVVDQLLEFSEGKRMRGEVTAGMFATMA